MTIDFIEITFKATINNNIEVKLKKYSYSRGDSRYALHIYKGTNGTLLTSAFTLIRYIVLNEVVFLKIT